jgi:class 3 adenylate cyclase
VHTGECDIAGDVVTGPTVEAGAEIATAAGVGDVLVSGTVKDIVAGSGIDFEERGPRPLGTMGETRLYVVTRCA